MVEVENLTVTYQMAHGVSRAVESISIRTERGEFLTLLGPSGCGKTSALRAIAGLERPAGGRISTAQRVVFDHSQQVDVPAHERDIAMVFQSYAIWPHLTVAGNVGFPLETARVPTNERDKRIAEALGLVGLSHLADRRATQLSGGQQQRVAIARAIVRRSPLILLDEPLSNLDAKLREQMRSELRELLKGLGITAIYVTHDQEEALTLSDRIVVMDSGRVVESGAPAELYLRPRTVFAATFLGQAELFALTGEPQSQMCPTEFGTFAIADALVSASSATHLMIRPEAIRVRDSTHTGANVLSGHIIRTVFAGRAIHYVVKLASGRLLNVIAPPHDAIEAGSAVTVELPAERLRPVGAKAI